MTDKALEAMHRKVAEHYKIEYNNFMNAKLYGTLRACAYRRIYIYVLYQFFDIPSKEIASMFKFKKGSVNWNIRQVRKDKNISKCYNDKIIDMKWLLSREWLND